MLQLSRPERLNTMAPAFFPALRDAVRAQRRRPHARAGDLVHRQALQRRHGAGRVRRRHLNRCCDTARARRLAFQDGLRQLMRCFDVLERRASRSSPRCRAAASAARWTWPRPATPRLQRRRLLHRAGDPHRHGRRPGRAAAPAQDRAAGRGARDGLHRRPRGRRARAGRRPGQRRAARRRRAAGARAGAGAADRRQVAAGDGRQQAGAQLRRRPPDRRRAAADDAAAERHLRHRRDGHRHRGLEGQAATPRL
jgi:hypothetical protein